MTKTTQKPLPIPNQESPKNKLDTGQKITILILAALFFLFTFFNALSSADRSDMDAALAFFAASACAVVFMVRFWRRYI